MAKILLVDDEPVVLNVLARLMESEGHHQVVRATNGKTALSMLESDPYDLIVTDLMMPDCDGLELIMSVRQTYPSLNIIAISGYSWKDEMQDRESTYLDAAEALGSIAALRKPLDQEEFLAAIRAALPSDTP